METSYPRFIEGIRQEHCDEASFLYEQRVALLASGAVPWPALDDFEQRLEAHLDALVVAGAGALVLASRAVVPDEPGTTYVALSLACRLRRADALSALLGQAATIANPAGADAAVDALADELPDEWAHFVEAALHRQPRLVTILARVAGRRRLRVDAAIEAAIAHADDSATRALVTTLGQLGQASCQRSLQDCLRHSSASVREAALLSLLRIGDPLALRPWRTNALTEPWPVAALALGGDRHAASLLAAALQLGLEPSACLPALGQLGDPEALRVLYDALKTEAHAMPASAALERLTGAELREEIFVPEQVDESELFDDELAAWRARSQLPLRGDGRPYGETLREANVDLARWGPWLTHNLGRFVNATRYRRGAPCTPKVLLAELRDPRCSAAARQSAADELAIRYRCPIVLYTSMRVAAQERALDAIAAWVAVEGSRFTPGGWYLAGLPQ